MITSSTEDCPSDKQTFCSECGAKTITACPHCSAPLRGFYRGDGPYLFIQSAKVESFCYNCGTPYPWIESGLEAAKLLIQESDDIPNEQKNILIESLPDIITETPKSKLATTRFKKVISATGKFTAEGIRQFIIDFGCEVVKKQIGL